MLVIYVFSILLSVIFELYRLHTELIATAVFHCKN